MKLEHLLIAFLFVSSFFIFYYASDTTQTKTVQISRVIDGDTLELVGGEKVRLKGINAPEKGMPYSIEAKNFLEQGQNKSVRIVSFGKDRYGRILGYIIFEGKNLNEEILKNGLGNLYYYGEDKYYTNLKNAETKARKQEKGIWSKSNNYGCLEIEDFVYYDLTEKDFEKLVLKNICENTLDVFIKDDARHTYEESIKENLTLETQNIWNDDGDSIYVWDDSGLLLFYRYP